MKNRFTAIVTFSLLLAAVSAGALAQSTDSPPRRRYAGNLLDGRSIYGKGWFPEPLRAPTMDAERELRLDYFHGEGSEEAVDEVEFEFEYTFGLLTLEIELEYERESESELDPLTATRNREVGEGIGPIKLSARHPVFQYVSEDQSFDYTIAAALEVAIPTLSEISRDTAVVPSVYQLLRLGDHFSVQGSAGYAIVIGPDAGGDTSLEYDLVVGYNLPAEDLPLPGITRTTPMFELVGEYGLSGAGSGDNALFGTIGARFDFMSIGPGQPRIGIGYVFPIDEGARDSLDWGIVTSLVYEF